MAKKQTAIKEEPGVEVQPEGDNHQDSLISRVYLSKITGLEILEGPDADADIKAIRKACGDDDSPFTFYEEDGEPVYMAIKNTKYEPFYFPEPGPEPKAGTGSTSESDKHKTGMTSMELYSKAVTLPMTIEKIIELETQPKPSLIDQAKKIMTPTIAIVACVLVIFLLVAMMKG